MPFVFTRAPLPVSDKALDVSDKYGKGEYGDYALTVMNLVTETTDEKGRRTKVPIPIVCAQGLLVVDPGSIECWSVSVAIMFHSSSLPFKATLRFHDPYVHRSWGARRVPYLSLPLSFASTEIDTVDVKLEGNMIQKQVGRDIDLLAYGSQGDAGRCYVRIEDLPAVIKYTDDANEPATRKVHPGPFEVDMVTVTLVVVLRGKMCLHSVRDATLLNEPSRQ